jgi:hypothetical protein
VEPHVSLASFTLRLNNREWGDLGTDACITLAPHSRGLIGSGHLSGAMSAALSEANLGAKGDYSEARPTSMLPSRKFADTGV